MDKIVKYIEKKIPCIPQFAIVLGSGLSSITDDLSDKRKILFSEIPGYPQTTITGHKGEFIFGYLKDIPILCARGRFHLYEGLSLNDVTMPIRLYSMLKIPNLIITNSAGCVNFEWNLGEIMLIIGHLDFTFRNTNPKINVNKAIYKKKNHQHARNIAKELDLCLREGVYTWTLGPTYETPSEIKEIRNLGGDAVGMSTLPEIIEAGEQKLNMWAFSCFTNMAAGIENNPLTHEEVLLNAKKYRQSFKKFISKLIITYKKREIK